MHYLLVDAVKKSVLAVLLWFTLLIEASIIVSMVYPVTSSIEDEDFWVPKSPMPTARGSLGAGVVDGKIYAVGGGSNQGLLNVNEEYNPETNTWTVKKPMPTPRDRFALSVYQNKIYCIGGIIGNNLDIGAIPTDTNQVYDPATDTWANLTSMPTPRMAMQSNVVDGKIYVIGGTLGGFSMYGPYVSDKNEVYDPSSDSWSTAAPMPTPLFSYASAVVDNKIYVIGGSGSSQSLAHVNLTQVFDTQTNQWAVGNAVPAGGPDAAAGVTTGVNAPKRIYVIGGRVGGAYGENSNQVYDPETGTWTIGANMPSGRYSLAVAVVDDVLYALGGNPVPSTGSPVCAVNEQYTPIGYQTPSISPEPTATLSPTPILSTPSSTASLIPSPTITDQPTPSPKPDQPGPFPTILPLAAVVAAALVGFSVAVYIKRRTNKH
jgi:N-acetylneuraminic acid mutarotase